VLSILDNYQRDDNERNYFPFLQAVIREN